MDNFRDDDFPDVPSDSDTENEVENWSSSEGETISSPVEAMRKTNPALQVLQGNTITDFADYIKKRQPKSWVILTGAGISTSCGIPDFRSPETGLYANLARYGLPYPEAIFDIDYFKENPIPFSILSQAMFPGKYLPAPAHYFAPLLQQKDLLLRLYTQNIDTLDRLAGVDNDLIVEAHGSFEGSSCVGGWLEPELRSFSTDETGMAAVAEAVLKETKSSQDSRHYRRGCGAKYPTDFVRGELAKGKVPLCTSTKSGQVCDGLVKPNIVFFGESLPQRFDVCSTTDFRTRSSTNLLENVRSCDLLIVMGTSLQVHPFAGLINLPGPAVPRLLINAEKVGVYPPPLNRLRGFDFDGSSQAVRRDAFYQGGCDEGIKELCRLLGWKDELDILIKQGWEKLRKEWGDSIQGGVSVVPGPVPEEFPEEDQVAQTAHEDASLADLTTQNLRLDEGDDDKDSEEKDKKETATDEPSAPPQPHKKDDSNDGNGSSATPPSNPSTSQPPQPPHTPSSPSTPPRSGSPQSTPGTSKLDRIPVRSSMGISLPRNLSTGNLTGLTRNGSNGNLPSLSRPINNRTDKKPIEALVFEFKPEDFEEKEMTVVKPDPSAFSDNLTFVTKGGIVLDLHAEGLDDDVPWETEITI